MKIFNRRRQMMVLEGDAALDALDKDLDWYLRRQEAIIAWGFRFQGFVAGILAASIVWLLVMLMRY